MISFIKTETFGALTDGVKCAPTPRRKPPQISTLDSRGTNSHGRIPNTNVYPTRGDKELGKRESAVN